MNTLRSDGWRQKVTDNKNINADKRHMALAAGCDGIPFHKDKNSSSGWPFVVTAENLPGGAYRKNQHQHIFAVAPSDEIRYDSFGNTYVYKKDPPNIQCVLLMFVDELLTGQEEGFDLRDFSIPRGMPGHSFNLKTILLFFMGDYPGQGKVANMKHSGKKACHWCHHPFESHSKGHNVALGTRQHLDEDDPFRHDDSFPRPELRPAPPMRDHCEMCDTAANMANLSGPELAEEQKRTGINGECWLSHLHMFNMVWDITGDMMHILKGMWGRRLIPLLKGNITQAAPVPLGGTKSDGHGGRMPYTAEEMLPRTQKNDEAKLKHQTVRMVQPTHERSRYGSDAPRSTYCTTMMMSCIILTMTYDFLAKTLLVLHADAGQVDHAGLGASRRGQERRCSRGGRAKMGQTQHAPDGENLPNEGRRLAQRLTRCRPPHLPRPHRHVLGPRTRKKGLGGGGLGINTPDLPHALHCHMQRGR